MEILDNFNANQIISRIYSKKKLKRYAQVVIGVFLSALAFNLFFLPRKIIFGGISGLSIVVNIMFDIEPALFIFITNTILLLISFLILGKEKTYKSIVVTILFPIFIQLTSNITDIIDFNNADTLILALFGAVVMGFSTGLIYKAGYIGTGTDIISVIFSQYQKTSFGQAILIINSLIVLIGALVSGWTMALYAIIVLYIISTITDKVLLGISNSKAFHIITSKETEITHFILENLSHGVTIINAYGAYSGKQVKVLMCVIPTKDYFKLQEGIKELDSEAFFIATDAYEVHGAN